MTCEGHTFLLYREKRGGSRGVRVYGESGEAPMRSGAQRAIMPGEEKSPGIARGSFL